MELKSEMIIIGKEATGHQPALNIYGTVHENSLKPAYNDLLYSNGNSASQLQDS